MKYKFTIIGSLVGLILGVFLFFKSGTLLEYSIFTIIFALIFGLFGFLIDKKKYIIFWILFGSFLIIFLYFGVLSSGTGEGPVPMQNIITGKCFYVTSGHRYWYGKFSRDCAISIAEDRCKKYNESGYVLLSARGKGLARVDIGLDQNCRAMNVTCYSGQMGEISTTYQLKDEPNAIYKCWPS